MKNLLPVDHAGHSGLDAEHIAVNNITASRRVRLIITLDISGRFEIVDHRWHRRRFADLECFGCGIYARRRRVNLAAQELLVYPVRKLEPKIRQRQKHAEHQYQSDRDRPAIKYQPQYPPKTRWRRGLVSGRRTARFNPTLGRHL